MNLLFLHKKNHVCELRIAKNLAEIGLQGRFADLEVLFQNEYVNVVEALLKIVSAENNDFVLEKREGVPAPGLGRRWDLFCFDLIPLVPVYVVDKNIVFPSFAIVSAKKVDNFIIDKRWRRDPRRRRNPLRLELNSEVILNLIHIEIIELQQLIRLTTEDIQPLLMQRRSMLQPPLRPLAFRLELFPLMALEVIHVKIVQPVDPIATTERVHEVI